MSLREDALGRLGRSLDEVADATIADLIDEAEVEARAKVRTILVEAIAERLLDRVPARLTGTSEDHMRRAAMDGGVDAAVAGAPGDAGESRRRKDDPAANAGGDPNASGEKPDCWLALYLYGAIFAEGTIDDDTLGIDGVHPLTVVAGDGVAAVGSWVPLAQFGEEALQDRREDLGWLEQTALQHETIVERIREQHTLVPMRMCTLYHDERSVQEMLSREQVYLLDALRRLAGRTEWGVKIFLAPGFAETESGLSEPPRASVDRPDADRPGERYLAEKHRQRRSREQEGAQLEEACQAAHERLAALSVEAKVNPLQPQELTNRREPMIFNGVYLVEDGATDELDATISQLQEHLGRRFAVELTGPWPPYNFVNNPTEVGR